MRRLLIILLAAGSLAAFCFVYYSFDPSQSHFFPRCPFFALTGYMCPGCGSQRVVHALLHLDFAAAFRINPYMVLMLPLVAASVFAAIFRVRYNGFYRLVNSRPVMIGFVVVTVAWWVWRNVG